MSDSRKSTVVWSLTLSRLLLAGIFAILMEWPGPSGTGVALGLAVLLASELTDLLDGLLARRWGVTSSLGALIDPYTDSLSRLLIYWSLARTGAAWDILPLAMAWRDITVAYCRMILLRSGTGAGARRSGKVKAAVQGFGAYGLLLSHLLESQTRGSVASAISAVVLLVTLWSVSDYVRDAMRARATDRGAEASEGAGE